LFFGLQLFIWDWFEEYDLQVLFKVKSVEALSDFHLACWLILMVAY
jgi:hypothetical protein